MTEPVEAVDQAELVFVPTEPVQPGAGQAQLQLRQMEDGRKALLAYTSLALLVAGCGSQQAWIAAPIDELENLQLLTGFDVVALNVDLPGDMRVTGVIDTEDREPGGAR